MEKIKSDTTQEKRVLEKLQGAAGEWINGQYFLKQMMLSQYHRALWNLIHRRDRYEYDGQIEISDFKCEFGFKSYRLVADLTPKTAPAVVLNIKRDKPEQGQMFSLSRQY